MSAERRLPVLTAARATAGVLAVALLATACASGDEPTATVSTSPAATASATPSSTPSATATTTAAPVEPDDAGADVPFGTSADGTASEDARLSVTGLRTGSHDGYDRVVIDLGGTGTPGWHAEVGTTAAEDPTGTTVDLGGAGVLTLYLSGLGYPYETGQTELAAGTEVPGPGAITATSFSGTFEAEAQVFVGLADAGAEFRVFLLEDPVRLVVDIRH